MFQELLSMPVVASEHGQDVDNFIIYIHWLMAALFIGWTSYYLYALFRFRESKNKKVIDSVQKELKIQLDSLPRKKIALGSLKKNGLLIFANSNKKISEIINIIAPEHLELSINKFKPILKNVKNAGSICTGKYSAMAVTDYCAGSNHTLPTHSSAKFFSGLSVFDFFKRISYINLSKKGIETIGEKVINLATYEGLDGHAKSVKLRLGE
mgnify:CR=1 FL=1